jgi:hypothetical protein
MISYIPPTESDQFHDNRKYFNDPIPKALKARLITEEDAQLINSLFSSRPFVLDQRSCIRDIPVSDVVNIISNVVEVSLDPEDLQESISSLSVSHLAIKFYIPIGGQMYCTIVQLVLNMIQIRGSSRMDI